jgi:ABC-type antimicrobial peptide transport system permease subunit
MSDTATPPRPDWPIQAADAVVRYVDRIRSSTTDKAMALARAVVYGTFAILVGTLLGILALIGVFRALDNLRDLIVADSVWLTYVVLGAVFVIVGQFLFARRNKAR